VTDVPDASHDYVELTQKAQPVSARLPPKLFATARTYIAPPPEETSGPST